MKLAHIGQAADLVKQLDVLKRLAEDPDVRINVAPPSSWMGDVRNEIADELKLLAQPLVRSVITRRINVVESKLVKLGATID